MPARASGEAKMRMVKNTQKNGDIYVYERQTLYDPATKQTKVLSSRLMGKIPKGSDRLMPTRPKQARFSKVANSANQSSHLAAKRSRVGMMEIVDRIGIASGIDESIYSNTGLGTTQKILSVARYLLASNGQTLPGILTWQFTHALPYEESVTEDIYHDLFSHVGRDEALQQNFFANERKRACVFQRNCLRRRNNASRILRACVERREGHVRVLEEVPQARDHRIVLRGHEVPR